MKKFNCRKSGILLVMMLVAGFALVGQVSAWDEEYDLSDDGEYDVWVGGTLLFDGEVANYYGQAGTVSGEDADLIYIKLELYHDGNTLLQAADDHEYDTDFFEVTNFYDHHAVMEYPYARVEMFGVNPDDCHNGLICYLTPFEW